MFATCWHHFEVISVICAFNVRALAALGRVAPFCLDFGSHFISFWASRAIFDHVCFISNIQLDCQILIQNHLRANALYCLIILLAMTPFHPSITFASNQKIVLKLGV